MLNIIFNMHGQTRNWSDLKNGVPIIITFTHFDIYERSLIHDFVVPLSITIVVRNGQNNCVG